MNNCLCNPNQPYPIEFKINDSPEIHLYEPLPGTSNLNELKEKVINEFLGIINKLECGIKPDIEFLLEEISLIDIVENE